MRRERHLALNTTEPKDLAVEAKYSVMSDKMSEFESVIERRPKDLATSFGAGFFSLVAGFGALRLFRKSSKVEIYDRARQAESEAMLGPDAIE
jgi:hypothetical protein